MVLRAFCSLVSALSIAGAVMGAATAGHANQQASALTLRFEIFPMMSGSRPWDGTGLNSAQIDGDDNGLTSLIPGGSLLGQVGLDQLNQRIAPPDPYVCLVLSDSGDLTCYRQAAAKDNLQYSVTVPAELVDRPWFGVVLLDSDEGNLVGGQDDLIGFGVVLDEPTLAAVRQGDAGSRALAAKAERIVTKAVSNRFGLSRSLSATGDAGALSLAKLAHSKCEFGCTMGDSTIYIEINVDGW